MIIDTGKQSASKNMIKDAELLLCFQEPILHLYDWESDAATYGHFIDPEKFFKKSALDLAKRPTGGGIVFHVADFAFSILIPAQHPQFSLNPLDNYLFINRFVGNVIEKSFSAKIDLLPKENLPRESFCMAAPTKYDLMLHGKKVGGAAQRKTRVGFLHQGSILLGSLSDAYLEDILLDPTLIQKMKQNSHPLLGESWDKKTLEEARSLLKEELANSFDF